MKIAFVSLINNESRNPPLGLLALASYLKKNLLNSEIKLIDKTFENIEEEIKKFSPDVIGLTSFTSYYQDCIDFAKKIKGYNPNIKILIGGPHITTLPESLNKIFDFGIIGQGEKRTLKLLSALKENKSPSKIDGLAYWKKDKLIINPRKNEDKLFFDEYSLDYSILNKKYFGKRFIQEITDFQVYMGIISSIGCPFNCIFCSCKAFWGNIKYRKIENVINEMKELYYKYNVRHIEFYDDLFAINKDRLRQFHDKLKEENLLGKITFSCFGRADCFDEEMCILLKRLNVKAVTFGFESGSDRILKYIKNSQLSSLEKNKQAILLCKKYGFNVAGGLVAGNPTEKISDMKKNIEFIDFAKRNNASRIWIQILIPLPKTKIWDIALERGKISKNYDTINWNNIQIHHRDPMLLDDDVSKREFLKYYDLAKEKSHFFVYKLFLRTIMKDPKNISYFALEFKNNLFRLFSFIKQ